MHKRARSVDMTQGVIWKQLIFFALPLLVGQLFQQLYSTVDSVVVGRYVSMEALAAVGATGNVINALISFFSGLATGGGVIISQYFGAHDEDGVHKAVHTTVLLSILIAVFCTALGMGLSERILSWMDTPPDVMEGAVIYLKIYFAGVAGMMLYNIGSGILRAVGDSRRPLYFLIFSAVTNLILDVAFVVFFHMGIAGVAYATVISQCLSAILTFIVLCRSRECYRVSFRRLAIHTAPLRGVLRVGLPAGLQMGVTSLSNVFVQAYINAFDAPCMAGWTSYSRLDDFAWLPMMCIGMASTTFVGQNLGAGQAERARKGVSISMRLALIGTVAVVIPLMAFRDPLLKAFNDNEEMLAFGRMFILYMSPFYIPYCATQIYSGALRGAGDSLRPMVICLSSFVVFRQLYLFIGTKFITHPLFVGLSYPAGWVVSSAAMYLAYRFSKWEKASSLVSA